MAERNENFPKFLGMPLDLETWEEIEAVAEAEERKPTPMARLLLREGLKAWKSKHGDPKKLKKLASK